MLLSSNTIPLYLHVRQQLFLFFHRKRSLDYTFVLLQLLIKYVYTNPSGHDHDALLKHFVKLDKKKLKS